MTDSKPNLPSCHAGEVHNFQPLSKNKVYCTKCAAHVKFTKSAKK